MSTIKSDSIQPTSTSNNLILRTGVGDVERMRIGPAGGVTFSSAVSMNSTLNVVGVGVFGAGISANSTMSVGGAVTFSSAVSMNSTLNVVGVGVFDGGVTAASLTSKIQPITASIGSGALTITLNPTILDFRSSTLTNGTVTSLVVANPISLTIPSSSTMGTVSTVLSRIVVLAINNAGTVELAAVNIAGGSRLDETTLITTTVAAAAGNSATEYYSTDARSNVAYRVVGYIESTQATAGTWATAPTTIQGMGGQALTAMSSLGYGQTWQAVTSTRSAATTYYNTTGRPIVVSVMPITAGTVAIAFRMCFRINGIDIHGTISTAPLMFGNNASYGYEKPMIVPSGASYSVTVFNCTISSWFELR